MLECYYENQDIKNQTKALCPDYQPPTAAQSFECIISPVDCEMVYVALHNSRSFCFDFSPQNRGWIIEIPLFWSRFLFKTYHADPDFVVAVFCLRMWCLSRPWRIAVVYLLWKKILGLELCSSSTLLINLVLLNPWGLTNNYFCSGVWQTLLPSWPSAI